jgi:plasmid stability protein
MTWLAGSSLVSDNQLPMASLNIRNFPEALYRRLRAYPRRERRSVAEVATRLLANALKSPRATSILKLRGLGRELWHEADTAAHIDRERASWN